MTMTYKTRTGKVLTDMDIEAMAEDEEMITVDNDSFMISAGVWQHIDGAHYLVLGVATDSNNAEPYEELQVVYVSLEGYGREGSRLRIRGLNEFLERFVPVGK